MNKVETSLRREGDSVFLMLQLYDGVPTPNGKISWSKTQHHDINLSYDRTFTFSSLVTAGWLTHSEVAKLLADASNSQVRLDPHRPRHRRRCRVPFCAIGCPMSREEAAELQREMWRKHANELNQCSVEPGDGPGDWVVEVVWKNGQRLRYPSLVVEVREAVTAEELRAAMEKAEAVFAEFDDE